MLDTKTQSGLKNILFLSDFSKCSKAALPYAASVARSCEGKVFVLHIFAPDPMTCLTPDAMAATIMLEQRDANAEIHEIDSKLARQPHEIILQQAISIAAAVDAAILQHDIGLIVLGTHGRSGVRRFVLGSVAEEILRRSPVPVFMVGPGVLKAKNSAEIFREMLGATDFSPESVRAVHVAAAIAQDNQAHLALLHVIKPAPKLRAGNASGQSVATVMGQLHDLVPSSAEWKVRPEFLVQYGSPADCIVETAAKRAVDVIVLGMRHKSPPVVFSTHVQRNTAHSILTRAQCPVLVVPAS